MCLRCFTQMLLLLRVLIVLQDCYLSEKEEILRMHMKWSSMLCGGHEDLGHARGDAGAPWLHGCK